MDLNATTRSNPVHSRQLPIPHPVTLSPTIHTVLERKVISAYTNVDAEDYRIDTGGDAFHLEGMLTKVGLLPMLPQAKVYRQRLGKNLNNGE